MPKMRRASLGGIVYHVLNRANAREQIFRADGDFAAFEKALAEAWGRVPIRILDYVIMPSHWHLVLWPHNDGDLSRFTGWLTQTHAQRWHACHGSTGWGHVYQNRFKSFPVQSGHHFEILCRYVERNPVRANLVRFAQEWRWGSLWRRTHGDAEQQALLSEWPAPPPADWLDLVNTPLTEAEVEAIRACVKRNRPFGAKSWQQAACQRFGLASTLRGRGRPHGDRTIC